MTLMEKLFEKHMLMNKVKELQKENAELRECLKEAIPWLADISAEVVGNEPAKQIDELASRMKAALEGGNHAND